jgi:hypothetical protein
LLKEIQPMNYVNKCYPRIIVTYRSNRAWATPSD